MARYHVPFLPIRVSCLPCCVCRGRWPFGVSRCVVPAGLHRLHGGGDQVCPAVRGPHPGGHARPRKVGQGPAGRRGMKNEKVDTIKRKQLRSINELDVACSLGRRLYSTSDVIGGVFYSPTQPSRWPSVSRRLPRRVRNLRSTQDSNNGFWLFISCFGRRRLRARAEGGEGGGLLLTLRYVRFCLPCSLLHRRFASLGRLGGLKIGCHSVCDANATRQVVQGNFDLKRPDLPET